jgi:hypothetical protein
MKRNRFTVRAVGGKTMLGNRRGPWQVIDRARPGRSLVANEQTHRGAQILARVMNMYDGTTPCPRFYPDHNGECLLCDETAGDHTPAALGE